MQDNSIAPNVALKLLDAADEVNRVKELREDLDEWIAAKKKENKAKERRLKAETGKDPKPSEVKTQMPKELVDHWVSLIKEERPFDDQAEWDFNASISDEGRLQISALSLDLGNADFDKVIKVIGRMSQLTKRLTPVAQQLLQTQRQRKQVTTETAPYDFDLLRQIDPQIAKEMEEKYRLKLQKAPDGEEDAAGSQTQERTEADLAGTIELPDQHSESAEPAESAESATEPAAPTSATDDEEPEAETPPKPAPKPEPKEKSPNASKPKEKGKDAK